MATLLYYIIRWWARICLQLFYQRIVVTGLENIPADRPVIYLLNHQNTLLDALLPVVYLPGKVYFLARADLFEKPAWQAIMRFFRIFPIYRQKDGFGGLRKNKSWFERYSLELVNGNNIALFPEATHCSAWLFRPLQKGYLRLVRQVQENGCTPVIVPMYLHYSDHRDSLSQVWIEIDQAVDPDREGLHEWINQRFSQKLLKPVTQTVKPREKKVQLFYRWIVGKRTEQEQWTETVRQLRQNMPAYPENEDLAESLLYHAGNTNNSSFFQNALLLLLSSPVFLLGWTLRFPAWISRFFVNRLITDKQFHLSIRFVVQAILFSLYLLYGFWLTLSHPYWYEGLAIIMFFGLCIIFVPVYQRRWQAWQAQLYFTRNKRHLVKIRQLHKVYFDQY